MKTIRIALLALAIVMATSAFAVADTFDGSEALNHDAELTTDSQSYTDDDASASDLDDLLRRVVEFFTSLRIRGVARQKTQQPPEDAAPRRIISSGDYDYSINDTTAAIVKYNGDDGIITIPSEINEYQVTEIGAEAFTCRKLKSVSIPGCIRSIGKRAFEYCEITDALQLPKNVTISDDAFSYARLPSEVTIPSGTTVEACAFSYCKGLERVYIDADAVLKGRAFGYCDDLKLAVCAEGCRLETNAFEYCEAMEQAILRGDVETDEESFYSCGAVEVLQGDQPSATDGSPDGHEDASPEERILDIVNSPATLDGVTVTLDKATARQNPETGGFTYTLTGALENNSDEGIMQVIYTFALIDENGEPFRSFGIVYDGEDTAIPPHTKVDFNHDDIKWGKQSVPAAVEIGISSIKTEAELPPARVPGTGEYLYQALGDEKLARIKEEPPVALSFHVDQGGYGRTATFNKGDALDQAIRLLCAIKIGEETNEWVTDNYNWIELTWEDGSYTDISLNLYNLEYFVHSTPHCYRLENLDEFWSYCAGYLEEDS